MARGYTAAFRISAISLVIPSLIFLLSTDSAPLWAAGAGLVLCALATAAPDGPAQDWRTSGLELLLGLALGGTMVGVLLKVGVTQDMPGVGLLVAMASGAIALAWVILRALRHAIWRTPPGELASLPGAPQGLSALHLTLGTAGVLFAGVTAYQKIVLVAPLFEESVKFGLALLWARHMRMSPQGLWLMGVASGLAFGVFEHSFTYPEEGVVSEVRRAVFHAGTSALSCAWYAALTPYLARTPNIGWAATVPSIAFHALNNFVAFTSALVGVVALPLIAVVWALPLSALAFSIAIVYRPRVAAELTARGWLHFSLPTPPPQA